MEMLKLLPMVVALFLALGASDGLVIDKCQLGEQLNSTLPINILDQITNLVAKIVCHVEQSSRFNTSTINYVTGPNVRSFTHYAGHMGRSAKSSSEESSEEKVKAPKLGFNSPTVNPVTRLLTSTKFSGKSHKERKGRSVESSSEESSEENMNSTSSLERRKRSASRSSSEESSEEKVKVPKPGFNSSTVNPVTRPLGKNSSSGESHKERKGRSAESSSEESDERNIWTLYGLFQLPDRIACTSGFEPSLNLCSIACDSLIDDDMRDDITCVETLLNKMLSAGNSQEPSKALFSKLHEGFCQKDCNNAKNLEYFSTC